MVLPRADQIANVHEHLIVRDGGLPGVRLGMSVEGILGRLENNLRYKIDDPGPLEAAALVAYALAVGHVFNDANKRTAYTLGLITLDLNGLSVDTIDQVKLEEIVIAAAAGSVDIEGFVTAYADVVS